MRFFHKPNKLPEKPAIIFGMGGSGTRLVQSVAARGGFHMGFNLNHAGDALDLVGVLDRSITPVLAETGRLDYELPSLSSALRDRTLDDIRDTLSGFFAEKPHEQYVGFKNPRWIFLVPFLAELFPAGRFLHVIRCGMDIVASSNQNQFDLYGDDIVPEGRSEELTRKLLFWARVNTQAIRAGTHSLGKKYVCLRIEDVRAARQNVLALLIAHLGLPTTHMEYLMFGNDASKVRVSNSAFPSDIPTEIIALARRFDYLNAR